MTSDYEDAVKQKGYDHTVEELLTMLVKSLVANPREVIIDKEDAAGQKEIYKIDVNEDDRGKIIGRDGCVIDSFQTYFHALGCKRDKKVELEIRE